MPMRVKHIMKDGSERESISGVVIPLREFYEVIISIREQERRVKDAALLQR